ncbi:MAG: amidohydrolase [Clostridia bacterium]|nr:amidohydrolase [Clostridia bacterium]
MNSRIPIVDCHCHIYPEKVAARAVAGIGAFYDIPMNEDGTKATLQKEAAAAGITHSMIFSVATKPAQVRSINEFIAQEVAVSGGTMTGLGTMHPLSEDMEGDMQHLLSLDLRGVKLHPDVQGFCIDDERCMKIYALCEEAGIPVLLHTGDKRYDMSNPNRLRPTVERFPRLTFIAAHLGGYSVWDDAVAQLRGLPNLYFDCSSSFAFLTPARARELILTYGADHVIFGTDYPMWVPKSEVDTFFSLGLSEEDNEKILWKNAKHLFRLESVE